MQIGRFRPILYLQYFLLFVDVIINAFSDLVRFQNVILLVLYVIQDVCTVFMLIVTFLTFFNTYIFQAGLLAILIRKFKATIIITVLYLSLSISFHVWTMTLRWEEPFGYIDTIGFRAFYIIHRTVAVIYYYFYKRSALRLGDPRLYQDSEWIRQEFDRRR